MSCRVSACIWCGCVCILYMHAYTIIPVIFYCIINESVLVVGTCIANCYIFCLYVCLMHIMCLYEHTILLFFICVCIIFLKKIKNSICVVLHVHHMYILCGILTYKYIDI